MVAGWKDSSLTDRDHLHQQVCSPIGPLWPGGGPTRTSRPLSADWPGREVISRSARRVGCSSRRPATRRAERGAGR